MRLNKFVASATGMSRRVADEVIAGNRVKLNGKVVGLGTTVEPKDKVELDGRPIVAITTHTYLMVNKPVGYVCSRAQQDNEKIIYDLLPPHLHNLRLAGRLDRDSSGLVLMSDDGDFIQAVSHPSADKLKVYEVDLDRPLNSSDRNQLERGVKLADGPSQFQVRSLVGKRVTVALAEGRNRQIRRTMGALGYSISRLHRLSIGAYGLGDMPSGAWQEMTP